MTGVIFATFMEAAPYVQLAGHRRLREETPALFGRPRDERLFTLVSGMGPQAASAAARYAVEDRGAGRLINAGICGALRSGPHWKPGRVFVVSRAHLAESRGNQAFTAVDCDAAAWHHLPAADLITRRTPLFDTGERNTLARRGALVDMEGAAIAAYAHERGLPCTLIKGITDFADEAGREDLHMRLADVSRRIAGILAARLNTSRPSYQTSVSQTMAP
jgi:adenosylhomocysteine nucleosidase